MRNFIFFLAVGLLICQNGYSQNQHEEWTPLEKVYYGNLLKLGNYISVNSTQKISKDTLFAKYVYFDNVLKDTDSTRRNRRMQAFDPIFQNFPKTVDSIGIENLDAKPIRFYRGKDIYKPFKKALQNLEPNVFVYFIKGKEEHPLGYLLFEENSKKLASWILLNQGSSGWFFLTFNLL